jgi:hypothetical protein
MLLQQNTLDWLTYKQQSLFLTIPEACKCKNKVLAGSVSGEGPVSAFKMAPCCLITWQKAEGQGSLPGSPSSLTDTNPIAS